MHWLLALAAAARTFGGFAADEEKYLVGNLVCEPVAVKPDGAASGMPRCAEMDRKAQKELAFAKPALGRVTADGKKLAVTVEDGKVKVTWIDGARERPLARWSPPGAPVTSVSLNVYAARTLVAVEYTRSGEAGEWVVFDVRAAVAPEEARPAPAKPDDRTASDRALAKGGVWEQRQRPCDQAGVHLALARDRKFDIRIETKCQGQKDVTRLAGTWTPDGKDGLVLTFQNEGATEEKLACQLAACADVPEDCLSCRSEDVSFTLYVVRR
jgi:hypothetical protein